VGAGFRAVVILVAALLAAAPAGAQPAAFKNKVCTLVPAKTIEAVPGMSGACTEQAPLAAPGGKDYVGAWKGTAPTESIQITIEAFSDSGMLSLATKNLNEGLLDTPKKVSGIGTAAYEAKGEVGVEVKAASGKYIAIVILTNVRKPPGSPAAIEPLAKAVVAAL
jgi:hypothetical protein